MKSINICLTTKFTSTHEIMSSMAHGGNDSMETTPRPCIDRLTHAILKEASKNLKYYIDVKCRENAFVLNTNATTGDWRRPKTKLLLGMNRDPSDDDVAISSLSFPHKQKASHIVQPSREKEMCREELNFHMHAYRFLTRSNPRSFEGHQRLKTRSSSMSVAKGACRSRTSFKLSPDEKEHLIDNTADLIASLAKSRQSMTGTHQHAHRVSFPTSHSEIQSDLTDRKSSPSKSDRESSRTPLPRVTSVTPKSKPNTRTIPCNYVISITTGNCNGASTSAPIRIKLYGSNGQTGFHELVQSETHYVPFRKDQTDRFTLWTHHVGVLAGITIGHNRKDMKSSWFLSKVSIDDPVEKLRYEISCNGWLSIKSDDQKTMRDFPVLATIPNENKGDLNEGDEEIRSQSGYSSLSTNGTVTSNQSTHDKTNSAVGLRRGQKPSRLQRVSIGPTSVANASPTASYTSAPSKPSPHRAVTEI